MCEREGRISFLIFAVDDTHHHPSSLKRVDKSGGKIHVWRRFVIFGEIFLGAIPGDPTQELSDCAGTGRKSTVLTRTLLSTSMWVMDDGTGCPGHVQQNFNKGYGLPVSKMADTAR
ncbi:hypothetical protein CDAR_299871 [Caerostris darwini]|uniref:Uncharacterized protein n=1 Tax=Caerostris darwini TaxID=1538125 RepID=A0AAV4W4C5_9ARAC|nr:hypothetical protein CDAR_299871 [Caerostris darwini]